MAAEPTSLAGIRLALAGPGRVGTSLASWAVARGAELALVAGRPGGDAAGLAARLGARAVALDALASHECDLLLVAVPDPAITSLAGQLASRPQAAVALHASGCLPAAALAPLREAGCKVGSLHPLKAFPRPLTDSGAARGTVFAIDGDAAARGLARRLAVAFGGLPVTVEAEDRAVYHLAASLAAGGVVTLLAVAHDLAADLGLPAEAARGYLDLARGALQRAAEAPSPAAALTGPAARGDREVIRSHLAGLGSADPELRALVAALARETLRRRARIAELSREQRALLEELTDPSGRGAARGALDPAG